MGNTGCTTAYASTSFPSIPIVTRPAQLGKYVGYFSPDFIAATGSDDELTRLTRALGLIYTRTTAANGNIEVDHSGSAVIIDPQGRLIGLFRPPFTASALTADLATLAAKD